MKLALRWIPTEVWVDVFRYPGKSREELGEMADTLGRKFAEYLQFYLHEWGKRTLGILTFKKKAIVPRSSMPENIKFFENIRIWHFDSQTIGFLRRISTLYNGVNPHLPNVRRKSPTMANIRTVLGYLSPLLHGVHSLTCDHCAIPLVEQHFGQKLAQLKMLTLNLLYDPEPNQAANKFALNWLISGERDPAEPKFLKIFIGDVENLQQFCMAIRQQFLSAKGPCTFAIELLYCGDNDQLANFHEENNLGEQLDGQFNERSFAIYRHKQVDSARTQLEEWVKGAVKKSEKSCGIEFYQTTTIGQIGAIVGANEGNNAEKEEEDGPSTPHPKSLKWHDGK